MDSITIYNVLLNEIGNEYDEKKLIDILNQHGIGEDKRIIINDLNKIQLFIFENFSSIDVYLSEGKICNIDITKNIFHSTIKSQKVKFYLGEVAGGKAFPAITERDSSLVHKEEL